MTQPVAAFLQNVNTESSKATYSAVVQDFTPVANATDIITLTNPLGKTITLTNVRISGNATAATAQDIYILKRTTLNTGGTATNPTPTIHDSQDAAPTAVVSVYSANPTTGTGTALRGDRVAIPGSTGANGTTQIWDFGDRASKAPKLQKTTESIAINWGAAAVATGTNLYITIEWTEE